MREIGRSCVGSRVRVGGNVLVKEKENTLCKQALHRKLAHGIGRDPGR